MNLNRRIFYTLSLLSFTLLVACDKDDENDDPQPAIVGIWSLTSAEITFDDKSIRDFIEAYYNELGIEFTEEELDALEEAFNEGLNEDFNDGSTYEFKSNGTLIVKSEDDETEEGSWRMPDDDTLIVTADGESTEFEIESLTSSQMKISIESEEDLDLEEPETITLGLTLSLSK